MERACDERVGIATSRPLVVDFQSYRERTVNDRKNDIDEETVNQSLNGLIEVVLVGVDR